MHKIHATPDISKQRKFREVQMFPLFMDSRNIVWDGRKKCGQRKNYGLALIGNSNMLSFRKKNTIFALIIWNKSYRMFISDNILVLWVPKE